MTVERMGGESHFAELDFVNELLPQILLVALQDGVYFVGYVKYRNRTWAIFLVNLPSPNYEQWTFGKVRVVARRRKVYNESTFSNNWESIMTGDLLRGEIMENKDEVVEGVKLKHHSPQLNKVNQKVSSS
jgi:hypothetical protein